MEFKTRQSVDDFLKQNTVYLGEGGQGVSYRDRNNVYKVYYNFLDPFDEDSPRSEEEILRFKDVETDLAIFPHDVMKLNGEVIGDITRHVKAIDLDKINPLNVNLDRLIRLIKFALKEIDLITRQHIKTDDVMYNTLLGEQFYLIDTIDYRESEWAYQELYDYNVNGFNNAIIYFLIDGLFTEILKDNSIITEMYNAAGKGVPLLEFIYAVRKRLSELVGREIKTLKEARKYLNQNREGHYVRGLDISLL